jgi:hypothetical protein
MAISINRYGQPMTNGTTTDGRAIASLVLGIVGVTVGLLLWFIPAPSVLAVALGISATRRIHTTGAGGAGLARAGIIIGIIGVGISLVFLVLTLFALFAAPQPPSQGAS